MLVLLAITLSACSVLNPYEDDFACELSNEGKCITIDEAYEESLSSSDGVDEAFDKQETTTLDSDPESIDLDELSEEEKKQLQSHLSDIKQSQSLKTSYREDLYRDMSSLLKTPKTPLVAPPKVIRVLIPAYEGTQGELFLSRYVFFISEGPRWVLKEAK